MNGADRVDSWVDRFALLGDRSRLRILLTLRRDGPTCVTDLATLTGLRSTTVSQSLRVLRLGRMIEGRRSGHVVRYELTDPRLIVLLDRVLEPPGVPTDA